MGQLPAGGPQSSTQAASNTPTAWGYLKGMIAYLTNPNVTGMYGMWDSSQPGLRSNGTVGPGEGGVDLSAPQGTPVYALADGQIVGAGYWNDMNHGVVTTRVNVPGYGPQDLYYQHIVLDPSISQCTGGSCTQTVKKGQQIGTVGSYGETEMGFNAAWGGIWGTKHPGAWATDPRPMLKALMTSNAASTSTSSSSAFNPLDPSTWLPTLQQWGEYVAIFVIAIVLIIMGFYLVAEKQVNAVVGKAAKAVALA